MKCDITYYWTLCRALQAIQQLKRGGGNQLPNSQEWRLYPHTHIALFLSDRHKETQEGIFSAHTTDSCFINAKCSICTAANSQEEKKPHILEPLAADERSLYHSRIVKCKRWPSSHELTPIQMLKGPFHCQHSHLLNTPTTTPPKPILGLVCYENTQPKALHYLKFFEKLSM